MKSVFIALLELDLLEPRSSSWSSLRGPKSSSHSLIIEFTAWSQNPSLGHANPDSKPCSRYWISVKGSKYVVVKLYYALFQRYMGGPKAHVILMAFDSCEYKDGWLPYAFLKRLSIFLNIVQCWKRSDEGRHMAQKYDWNVTMDMTGQLSLMKVSLINFHTWLHLHSV